jgi:hypothetical protein
MDELKKLIVEEVHTYYNPNRNQLRRPSARNVLTDPSVLQQASNNTQAEQPYIDGGNAMNVDRDLEKELSGEVNRA